MYSNKSNNNNKPTAATLTKSPPTTPTQENGVDVKARTSTGGAIHAEKEIDVEFKFKWSGANKMEVLGEWDNWKTPVAMEKQDAENFSVIIKMKKEGEFAYKYRIDGHRWEHDTTKETVDDQHNGRNNIVRAKLDNKPIAKTNSKTTSTMSPIQCPHEQQQHQTKGKENDIKIPDKTIKQQSESIKASQDVKNKNVIDDKNKPKAQPVQQPYLQTKTTNKPSTKQ